MPKMRMSPPTTEEPRVWAKQVLMPWLTQGWCKVSLGRQKSILPLSLTLGYICEDEYGKGQRIRSTLCSVAPFIDFHQSPIGAHSEIEGCCERGGRDNNFVRMYMPYPYIKELIASDMFYNSLKHYNRLLEQPCISLRRQFIQQNTFAIMRQAQRTFHSRNGAKSQQIYADAEDGFEMAW